MESIQQGPGPAPHRNPNSGLEAVQEGHHREIKVPVVEEALQAAVVAVELQHLPASLNGGEATSRQQPVLPHGHAALFRERVQQQAGLAPSGVDLLPRYGVVGQLAHPDFVWVDGQP